MRTAKPPLRTQAEAWDLAIKNIGLARKRARGNRCKLQDYMIGLYKAGLGWDPSRGKFSTYARFHLKNADRRRARVGANGIRFPSHHVELRSRIMKSIRKAEQNGAPYSPHAIAEEHGVGAVEVEMLVRLMWGDDRIQSSRRAVHGEDHTDWKDIGSTPAEVGQPDYLHDMDRERLHRAMSAELTERESYILTRRFGLDGHPPWTLMQLAIDCNLSRERVRQIERGALRRLRRKGVLD